MALKVGFETFEGGAWKMMALKNNNATHLKKITVGTQDFRCRGLLARRQHGAPGLPGRRRGRRV